MYLPKGALTRRTLDILETNERALYVSGAQTSRSTLMFTMRFIDWLKSALFHKNFFRFDSHTPLDDVYTQC